jgi:hypothetical protein
VAVAAPVLAYVVIRSVGEILSPPPEPEWETIDPDNDKIVQAAYNDLHTRVRAGNMLNENDAQTLDEFRGQLRRIGLYQTQSVASEVSATVRLHWSQVAATVVIMFAIILAISIGIGIAAFLDYFGRF